MKLNLSSKLIGSFSIVLLLTVVVGLMGIYTSQTIRDRLDNTIGKDLKPANILGDVAGRVGFIRANSLSHLFTGSIDDMNRYESEVADWIDEVNTDLSTLETIFTDQATLEKLAEFRTAFETYLRTWREQVVPLSRANRDEEAFTLARKSGAGGMAAREAMYKLSELHDANVAAANHRAELANLDSRRSQYILSGVILLAIIFGLAFGITQSSLITGAVNTVSKAAQQVAAGDLDQRVTVKTGDEIESMANSFNTMTFQLKKMVEELKKHREHLEELVKERTKALSESEQRLLKAQKVARMGFLDVNLKTNEVYWSDEIYRLYGVNPQEQKASFELTKQLIYPDDLVFVMKGIDSAIQGISELDIDHRILRSDGTVLWVHEQAELIRDADGNPDHLLSTVQDITERKLAEDELRLTSEIFMNMAEGVYLIGMDDGIIKYANSRFENMFGYEPGEMQGKNVSIVNAPTDMTPEETKRVIMDILRKTGEWHGETKNIKKDGTPFWCYGNVSLFDSAFYGRVIISVHTDITNRKRAEEEARKMHQGLVEAHGKLQEAYESEKQLRDKLIQSEKLASLGQMGAKIAHEINNPLTVISGRAQLYLMEDLDEQLKKTFELIIRETKRIENITSAYRNLSRPVLPKQELLDLNAVLEESVENLINTGEIKHYKIQRNFYPDLPQVIGDSNRLVQVFRNLIVNASHAMADCEEKILTLRSAVSKDGKFAEISIQDTGSGIEKEKLDKIFEVYYTTKADGLGTGLGLVVVKDIVEKQHKGKVSVESEVGKGTTFTVQLPFKTERKQQKILIVDDEAYIREFYMTFFEEKGLEVFTAVNGKEALDNYEMIQPDIVLSDIEMPVMNGFELAEAIKLKKPEQKIVLMTGFYYEDSVTERLKKANIPFFTKPADLKKVWKMVSEELKCGL